MLGLGIGLPRLLFARGAAPGTPTAQISNILFSGGANGVLYYPKPMVDGDQVLWEMEDGTVAVDAHGDPVGRMDDLSPNGSNATQATSSNKPPYQTDGTLHWLGPDGGNDYLDLGMALDLETFTAFIVVDLGSGNQRTLDNRGTGLPGAVAGWHIKSRTDTNADGVVIDDGAGNFWQWPASARSAGTTIIQTLRYTANDGLYRENRSTVTPGSTSASMGSILSGVSGSLFTASNAIGTQSFGGDFFVGAVTSKFMSISEIEDMEDRLLDLTGKTV